MKIYGNEEAWCSECGCGVNVYPGAGGVQQGDRWLAVAYCYQHGCTGEYALFKRVNQADYLVPVKLPTIISHEMPKDSEGPLWQ